MRKTWETWDCSAWRREWSGGNSWRFVNTWKEVCEGNGAKFHSGVPTSKAEAIGTNCYAESYLWTLGMLGNTALLWVTELWHNMLREPMEILTRTWMCSWEMGSRRFCLVGWTRWSPELPSSAVLSSTMLWFWCYKFPNIFHYNFNVFSSFKCQVKFSLLGYLFLNNEMVIIVKTILTTTKNCNLNRKCKSKIFWFTGRGE